MAIQEWCVYLTKDSDSGGVTAALATLDEAGEVTHLDREEFGPFDTSLDVAQWFCRRWSRLARFPLR